MHVGSCMIIWRDKATLSEHKLNRYPLFLPMPPIHPPTPTYDRYKETPIREGSTHFAVFSTLQGLFGTLSFACLRYFSLVLSSVAAFVRNLFFLRFGENAWHNISRTVLSFFSKWIFWQRFVLSFIFSHSLSKLCLSVLARWNSLAIFFSAIFLRVIIILMFNL